MRRSASPRTLSMFSSLLMRAITASFFATRVTLSNRMFDSVIAAFSAVKYAVNPLNCRGSVRVSLDILTTLNNWRATP